MNKIKKIFFLLFLFSPLAVFSQETERARKIYEPQYLPSGTLVQAIVPLFPNDEVLFYDSLDRIVVEGTPDRIDPALDLLGQLDRPRRQVKLVVDVIIAEKGSLAPAAPPELEHLEKLLVRQGSRFSTFELINQLEVHALEGARLKMQIQPGLHLEMVFDKFFSQGNQVQLSYEVFEEKEGVLRTLMKSTVRLEEDLPLLDGGPRLLGKLNDGYLLVGISIVNRDD
jgi:hypothetical protein